MGKFKLLVLSCGLIRESVEMFLRLGCFIRSCVGSVGVVDVVLVYYLHRYCLVEDIHNLLLLIHYNLHDYGMYEAFHFLFLSAEHQEKCTSRKECGKDWHHLATFFGSTSLIQVKASCA